jgi:hypothetical protein
MKIKGYIVNKSWQLDSRQKLKVRWPVKVKGYMANES